MNRDMKIATIFVVNWNTSRIIEKCLDSIRRLHNLAQVKVVVVDNASTDDSVEKIRSYRFVHLIENNENIGMVGSINRYISSLDTPYLVLMHSDVILCQDTITKMISYMESESSIAALGCKLFYPNGKLFFSTFHEPRLRHLIQEFLPYRVGKIIYKVSGLDSLYMKFWSHDFINEVDSVGSGCVVIRKQAIDDVGNIPECYSNWLIEREWFSMMRRRGWRIAYYPDAYAYHYEKYSEDFVSKKTEYKFKGYVVCDRIIEAYLYYYRRNFTKMSFFAFILLGLFVLHGKIVRAWLFNEKRKIKYYLKGVKKIMKTGYSD